MRAVINIRLRSRILATKAKQRLQRRYLSRARFCMTSVGPHSRAVFIDEASGPFIEESEMQAPRRASDDTHSRLTGAKQTPSI